MYVHGDSSLKIQMEYRALEEHARGNGVGWGWVAVGASLTEGNVGLGSVETGGRYFKNRILIRPANSTHCNPYMCRYVPNALDLHLCGGPKTFPSVWMHLCILCMYNFSTIVYFETYIFSSCVLNLTNLCMVSSFCVRVWISLCALC